MLTPSQLLKGLKLMVSLKPNRSLSSAKTGYIDELDDLKLETYSVVSILSGGRAKGQHF